MRLIELIANKPSFNTVTFNPVGLTLIVGKKQDNQNNNSQKTYNGVGKSLIIELVHFCLASDPIEAFNKLTDWEFTLEFEANDQTYTSVRNTDNQKIILLNGEEYSCDKFQKFFQNELFYIDEKIGYLTFRSLLSRFVRRGKKNYISYNTHNPKETDYQKLINNSYLLGLDINRIQKKHELKKEFDEIEKLKKNIEKDSILREVLTSNPQIEINITDLEDNINLLSGKINNFEIAEDYKVIQDEADQIVFESRKIDNRIIIFENAINSINQSLEIKPDLAKEKIINLYEEANISMPELVIKKISEVEEFHNKLLNNRVKRLLGEKAKIEKIIMSLTQTRKNLEQSINKKLKYLNKHGALDEYTALNEKLNELKMDLSNLKRYEEVLENYNCRISEIKIAFEQENLNTTKYLKQAKSITESNMEIFRNLSRNFYDDKPGGIEVSNNEGENQTRFNISAHLKDDSSDGINEVKMFCFDFTILQAKHNNKMEFVFHDSRLLANMDPRQRAILFKVASKQATALNLQYIISANQDALESIKNEITVNEYEKIISENIILELTDESAETKLLGINVDLKYEKD